MKVNAKDLNKLFNAVEDTEGIDGLMATLLINTRGTFSNSTGLFKPHKELGCLMIYSMKGVLYQKCFDNPEYPPVKLDDTFLGKFDLSYDGLVFMRKYLGGNFKKMYLNVDELYIIANKVYDYIKETAYPISTDYRIQIQTINFINMCGEEDKDIDLFIKNSNGTSLWISSIYGRIVHNFISNEKFVKDKDMFISNSTLRKFPLTLEGEKFVQYWLDK